MEHGPEWQAESDVRVSALAITNTHKDSIHRAYMREALVMVRLSFAQQHRNR
jgi:hypothetical protein